MKKKIIKSGREEQQKKLERNVAAICPECGNEGDSYYCNEWEDGLLVRTKYTSYSCDCGTEWRIYSDEKEFNESFGFFCGIVLIVASLMGMFLGEIYNNILIMSISAVTFFLTIIVGIAKL